jgi:AcrR family transcriptional regulator
MDTREKILSAGLKLFSNKGYLGSTTKEIAREAGISEVTLFRHFPSKEKLFEEVIHVNSFLGTLKDLLPNLSKTDYEEALFLIARRFFDFLCANKDLIRIMQSEIQTYPEKIHEIYHSLIDEVYKTLAKYFLDMQNKGVLRDFDAEYGVRSLFGMLFSYFNAEEFLLRKKYRSHDADKAIKEFVGIFARGTMKEKNRERRAKIYGGIDENK